MMDKLRAVGILTVVTLCFLCDWLWWIHDCIQMTKGGLIQLGPEG